MKVFLAFVSLVLATLVWILGLVDSFGKPSVAPALSLEQQELSLLAQPKVPGSLQPLVVGDDPAGALLRTLRDTPLDRLDDRQILLFTALEQEEDYKQSLRQVTVGQPELIPLQQALNGNNSPGLERSELLALAPDPLIRTVACSALGGPPADCVDQTTASAAARRLIFSEVFPLAALILGGLLLLRHGWQLLGRRLPPWPPLVSAPLGPLDMILLVAGGFVVLGEVLVPLLIAPFTGWLSRDMSPALMQGVTVLFGYAALAIPPLLILRQQLSQCDQEALPPGGWLQWQARPIPLAFLQGARGWLMVMPPVVMSGWLVSRWIGDQGGSNPLLEIVLNSRDPLALSLLAITAVVMAPLFEETIFRGVLLPVLGRSLGRSGSVMVSALVFAIAHLSIGELPPLLVLGLGLALLRLSTGRLFPCVVMHALWNGVTFLNLLLLGG
ncbi:MAG: CPBP family intramembrane metalloprotease [Synechococcus sp. BS307-5m-G39]|nr:CPBP family intramembrane metalloprotease [Synechococcus sp. BS307-5m-G39]